MVMTGGVPKATGAVAVTCAQPPAAASVYVTV